MYFKNKIVKIDQVEGGVSRFEVPGSKTTVSGRHFTFSMYVAIWWWKKTGSGVQNAYSYIHKIVTHFVNMSFNES